MENFINHNRINTVTEASLDNIAHQLSDIRIILKELLETLKEKK
jgi:hypothetical protein